MPMAPGSNVALLERIVADQRKILADVTGKDPSKTPTLWALYKEVQDYYDKGMRTPDDVTLLFSDDNWGNIRRLPCHPERSEGSALCKPSRSGGFGVYYHFDYVGGPRNYKWINTNPIARVWEQMHLANEYGANRIWIVNVGDLKPMEFPIQFFLDYAWDPSKWPAERLPEYTRLWAQQQFGPAHAAEIADVVTTYLAFAGRRKPELLAPETYSLANYREAETVVADYAALLAQAERLSQAMPAESKDAFYELVLHPVQAAANLNALYVAAAKNRLYAQQGRASANDQADLVRRLFDRDAEISRYYNTQLAGGKWSHMMDQTHIGYTYWQEPPRNVMPRVDVIQVPAGVEMGVAYEGQSVGPPVFTPGQPRGSREAAFPDFDPYARQSYFLDIYSKRTMPFDYTVEAAQPWVQISAPKGRVDKEQRVFVSIDWSRAPVGISKVPVTVRGPDGARFVVQANVKNPAAPRREDLTGFVESNGYVSMEAEHYSRVVATAPIQWLRIPDLGRTFSGVTPTPVTASSQTPSGSSPRLEYQLFTFDSGAVSVHAYLSPTLNFTGSPTGLRYAVSFDDEVPQIVNATADTTLNTWNQMVADNIAIMTTKHQLARPGAHVLKFWMVDPGIVLQKLVVDAGGLKPSYLGPPESFRAAKAVSKDADPRFDWFEYQGNDAAFNAVAAGPDDYRNPILAGFYPDPSMVRVGDDYYLVTSSFAYFPGIPIFHSKDLVDWTQIGHVLDRRSQLNLDSAGISRGLFAPAIRYNAGTFYMIVTLVDRGGNFFVTATNPAGPWSDPVWLPSVDGIDPSFFFDDDGKAYVINNGPPIETPRYSGHRAIWIQEFDIGAKKMVGPRTMIVNGGTDLSKNPIWIEAPHIFKRNGFYYLICAEGGTAYQHSEVVFRGSAPTGPWTPYAGNPILTQRHLDRGRPFPITTTGHADFVDTPSGEWWAVFLGVRPYDDDLFNTGRETFLMPVRWVDDWPVITTGNELVPYAHRRPALPRQPTPPIPTSGNFTVRDEFDSPTLPMHWMTIRGPGTQWYDLTSSPGSLTLRSRAATFQPSDQPSFVGRRQQHADFSASTAMTYAPLREGDKAGMVAFQNDQFYYFLAVARVNGQTVVQLEKHAGPGEGTIVASAPLTGAGPVYLKIQGHGALYDFSYGTRPHEWKLLQHDADGTVLSTKVAQGFVGAMIGLYAYSPSH
jgi:beta-xylosidase